MIQRWSYSKFSLADQCLKAFQIKYEVGTRNRLPLLYDKLRETGKSVHRCIELYKAHLHASGVDQDLTVVTLIVEEVFSTDREVTSTAHYNDTLFIFKAFAMRYRHNPKTYLGAEFLIERELPESDVIVEGFPDHVELMKDEEGPIVVSDDVKSGYSSSVTSENKFQGELASWMLMPMFEGTRVGWRISWPRNDMQSDIVEFKPAYSQALEARMRSIVARVDRAREEKKWPTQPGSWCDWCPIAAKCRDRNVLAKVDALVTTQEEAEKATADLVVVLAAYNQRREQVKQWATDHGPVIVGDMEAGFMHTKPGLKIGDVGLMIMRLGLLALIKDEVFTGEDDPRVKTKDSQNLIAAAGIQIAIKEKLVVANGDKTKNKGVQNDERLKGLWLLGDSKTKFDLYKVGEEK